MCLLWYNCNINVTDQLNYMYYGVNNMEDKHTVTLNKEAPDITEEEIWYFIGQHQDYYMPIWKVPRPDRHASWNWPAFLFGIYWFGYRKMYKMILYTLGLFTGFYILEELLNIKIYYRSC